MAPTPVSTKKGVKRTSTSPAPKAASASPALKSQKKAASASPALKGHTKAAKAQVASDLWLAAVLDGVELSEEISESCKKMLSVTLPFAVAAASDKRSPEMIQVVDMVRESLESVQQQLKSDVEEEEGRITELNDSKGGFADAITAARGVLAASAEELASKKKGVEDAALASKEAFGALKASRSALDAIAQEELTGESDVKTAEDAVKNLLPALTTEWEPTGANAARQKMMEIIKALPECSGSLYLSFASSIEKAPADRGPFDGMAIDQMRKFLAERAEQLAKNRETIGDRKSALEAVAQHAKLDEEKAQDFEVAASDELSSEEEKYAEAARAAKTAKDAEENFEPNMKKIEAALNKKVKTLLRFEQHTMSCFAKLADRVSEEKMSEETSENVIAPVEDLSDSVPAVPMVDVEHTAD